jgi:hypothetical protein
MLDLSWQEKSLCGSLLAVAAVAIGYFVRTVGMAMRGDVQVGEVAGLSIGAVVLLVVVQLLYKLLLVLHARAEPADERDRHIAALGARDAYCVLQVGLWLTILHLAAAALVADAQIRWFAPFVTGQLAVFAAVAAEIAKYGSQLLRYRIGG